MHLEVVESGCDEIALNVHFDRKNVRLANKWRLFDDTDLSSFSSNVKFSQRIFNGLIDIDPSLSIVVLSSRFNLIIAPTK